MAALAVEQAHLAVEQAHLTVQQAVVTQPHAVTMAAHANETQVPRKDRVNEWLKGDAELLRYEQLLAAPKGSGSALRRLSEEKRLPEKTLEGRLKRARQRRDGAEWQAEQDGEERQTKHARYQRAKAAQLSAEVKAACTSVYASILVCSAQREPKLKTKSCNRTYIENITPVSSGNTHTMQWYALAKHTHTHRHAAHAFMNPSSKS